MVEIVSLKHAKIKLFTNNLTSKVPIIPPKEIHTMQASVLTQCLTPSHRPQLQAQGRDLYYRLFELEFKMLFDFFEQNIAEIGSSILSLRTRLTG
jgi:hypothetical protein